MRNVPAADIEEHFLQNMGVHEDVMMSANANLTSDPSRGTISRDVLEHCSSLDNKSREAGISPMTV